VKTIEFSTLRGVRNDVSLDRFDRDEKGKPTGMVDLSEAVNVDLDETGKIMRRLGTTLISAGANHSLFSSPLGAYVVSAGVLSYIAPTLTLTAIQSVAGPRLCYAPIIDRTYWSDTLQSGCLNGAVSVPWGIAVPPILTASATAGDMRAGRYMFAMTYVRSTGEESGAPKYGEIILAANQGISFTGLPVSTDPLVTTKRIYITPQNGENAYLAGEMLNTTASATFTQAPLDGPTLRTQFMGPPPAGQVVGYFAGRSYIASGRFLLYSQPYEYGLFDLRTGFVGFPTGVQTFAAVADGVFVGTQSETNWLGGTDPTQWVRKSIATFGTALGTEYKLREDLVGSDYGATGTVMAWMSRKGICLGFDGGVMQEVSGGRYIPPTATEGASLLKIRGGTPQLITTLYN
jgi:hypothetical protein